MRSNPMYRQIFLSIILLLCLSCKQEIKTKKVKNLSPVAKVTAFKKLEQSCADCHEEEYKDWRKSHHFKAMAPANDESVLGDFNQQSFTNPQTGLKSLFFKNAKDYIIRTQGDDGELHDFKVLYTYGFKPLQQYIVAFPNGRLQCLHLAWDTEDKKWFHLYPKEKISSGEWLHWSRGGQNWNSMCADCHSTYLEKNFYPVKKSYDSKWEQINVSCQACHEKAKEHDSWQRYQTASDSEKEKASQDAEWLHSGSVDPIISNKKQ